MGYNLTNEQIQNTYQQLVQVSGSTLLDGTGSVISLSTPSASYADYAVTASYALNGGGGGSIDTSSLVTNTTFNAYTSSNDSSVAGKLETSTFNTYTSSNDSSVAGKLDTTTFNSYTSSNDSVVNALVSATSSYLTSLPSGVVSSSAQTVSNLEGQVVSVDTLNAQSASIGHIDFVTGSATIIGDAFIILNNALPTLPKGGISVIDTGSATTSSFFWDGENDDWMYEYHLGGDHEQAVALFGSGSAIGSPNYPTNNKIQKGTGTHHLHDSNISDDGSQVSITGPVSASTYYGDGSNLTGISAGVVSGTGISSIASSPSLTSTPATASGNYSIALGLAAESLGTRAISMGENAKVWAGSGIAIGYNTDAYYGESVAIGTGAQTQDARTVAIGYNAIAGNSNNSYGAINILGSGLAAQHTDSIIMGRNAFSTSADNEINIGGIFKYNGSNTIDLTSTSLLKVPSNLVGGGAPSVSGNRRFVFANGSSTSVDDSVILGGETNDISSAFNAMFGTSGTTISSGDLSVVVGGYQHTINGGARNVTIGGEGVTNNQDYAIVLGRKSFTTPNPHTTYTANLDVSGSITAAGQINTPVFAGSIASSTSSIDFDGGNFATLNCASSTFVANPSNLKSGTTYTIIVTNGANISGYGTTFKFAGGTAPTLSAGTDVITMVSDGTSLYATALADFQ